MRWYPVILTVALALGSSLWAQSTLERSRHLGPEAQRSLLINNRVLACPNNNPITVMDLTRKLDMMFLQQNPDYADSPPARYQYYQMAWRPILDQMINDALILADAEEKEIEIADGDIHREIEDMFGPDVVGTLDRLGISYEEAWEMVREDLTVSQMRGFMVYSRAFTSVAPSMVAEAYEAFTEEIGDQDQWLYRVLSIRHPDRDTAQEIAELAEELLSEADTPDLERVHQLLGAKKRSGEIDARCRLSISPLQERTLDSLASTHRDALVGLDAGRISSPFGQVSRHDRCMVYRIFHLVEHIPQPPPPFKEVEADLKQQLVYAAVEEHQQAYINRLRDEYGVTEDYLAQMIPSDFQPFALR